MDSYRRHLLQAAALGSAACLVGKMALAEERLGQSNSDSSTSWQETPSGPLVLTEQGWVRGIKSQGLNVFKGIPYASPPQGEWRWRAPQPPRPWAGVFDARQFGAACVQLEAARPPESLLKFGPQSEDCLTLNIWAPRHKSAGRLPVMVWVHGGSFRYGAGSLALYHGTELAQQGVIVITLNYRLGIFGTFAHPSLRRDDEAGGNYGLLDVLAALRWVQANIAAFGGDPSNVTLFGESAGGATVAYLLGSPLSKGLFAKAIIESGALDLPNASRNTAEQVAMRVAKTLNVSSAEELRDLSAETLLSAQQSMSRDETMPFIDGAVIKRPMLDAFSGAKEHSTPLLIGYNDNEAGFFGQAWWSSVPTTVGAESWSALKPLTFSYGSISESGQAQQVATERFAGVGTRHLAREVSRLAPVYAYRFGYVPPAERETLSGAIHTAEISYVFGHVAVDKDADALSQRVSRTMQKRWLAFARTGSPNAPGLIHWPFFKQSQQEQWLQITMDGVLVKPNPADAMLDYLETLSSFHIR